jgi:hypothetical protein
MNPIMIYTTNKVWQISSTIFLSLVIYWTKIGLGTHTWMVPLDNVIPNARNNLVTLVFYFSSIMLIKISALLLYARIFKVSRLMKMTIWAFALVCIGWWVASSITTWMFCTPVKKMINPFVEGHCATATSWYTSSAFINAFLDLVVLILPVPIIWSLQMTIYKRLTVTAMFFIGYW